MRKFLSSSAGVTFNEESPRLTYSIRKNCIEIIYKVNRGIYAIANLIHTTDGKALIAVNWGNYFKCIQNPEVQLPRIQKCCPKLYAALGAEGEVVECELRLEKEEKPVGCFTKEIDIPKDTVLINCLTSEIVNEIFRFIHLNIEIYDEICDNPPFSGWPKALDEVWN